MKTLVIIFSMFGLLTLNSCKQANSSCPKLDDKVSRTELMNDIINNHEYMTEFMQQMQNNDHAMQMMRGNKSMMGMMMQGNGMNMMNDSTTSMNMVHSIIKDGKMMGQMMRMMHDQGMMSDECMSSCIQLMNAKGMDLGNMHTN